MKIEIEIEAKFGSKAQRARALEGLSLMMAAWTNFYKYTHKKNEIEYCRLEIEEEK